MGMLERAFEAKERGEKYQTSITIDPEYVIAFYDLKKEGKIDIDAPFVAFIEKALDKYIAELRGAQ